MGDRGRLLVDEPPRDDDWYANLIWIDRRKCVLLVHAETLFPVFDADVRAAQLKRLGQYVTALAVDALASEGLSADRLGHLDPADVRVARTASRSLLGHMTDIAGVNHRLRRALHNRGGDYIVPIERATRRGPSSSLE